MTGFLLQHPAMVCGHMKPATQPHNRLAYSLKEFAELFGKERSWAYRMAQEKKIKVLEGFGTMMVPASEIERIISEPKNETSSLP